MLLTPPGVGKKPSEGHSRNWRDFLESDYKPPFLIEKFAQLIWDRPFSSFDFFRLMGPKYTWNTLSSEFKRANPNAAEKDIMTLVRYQYHNWMRPPCYEYALNKLFNVSFNDLLQAVHPLSDPHIIGNK